MRRFSIAVTEHGGGTDTLRALTTPAQKEGDQHVIDGRKVSILNAHNADHLLTLVKTDKSPSKKTKAFDLFNIRTRDSP